MVSLDFYVEPEAVTFLSLVRRSATDTLSMARMVVETLKGLFTGRFGLNDVAGPIGTAQAIGQAASAGLAEGFGQAVLNILLMIVMITVNLGIVNLLPLPALDGGRLLFLLWEGVTRHPSPRQIRGLCPRGGFRSVYRADSGHRLSRYFPHCPRIANKPGGPAAGPPFLKDRERGTVCNGEVQNK